jgi:hypothetical protein
VAQVSFSHAFMSFFSVLCVILDKSNPVSLEDSIHIFGAGSGFKVLVNGK